MPTRQTLRDFLVSIGSTKNSISMPIDPGSDGVVGEMDDLGVEPGTGQPLLDFDSGRSLLGDYTSFITDRNDFPISPGAHESAPTTRGSSLSRAETSSAAAVFADSSVGQNAQALNRSNSTIFDESGVPLQTVVDKVGNGVAPNGNILLSDTVAASSNSDIQLQQTPAVAASFAALRKYNTFSPTSDPPGFGIDADGNVLTTQEYRSSRNIRVQSRAGEYEPETIDFSADVSQENLASIARSMLLKAAGWDDSNQPGDSLDPDSAFDSVSIATLSRFPSIFRDNQRDIEPFRPRDAYGAPENIDGSSFLEGKGDVINRSAEEAKYTATRGATHTADQPFAEDPTRPVSERIQSLQAGIAIMGLCSLIDNELINIKEYVKELQVSDDKVLRGPYYMGTSLKSQVTTVTRALVRTFMFQTGIYSYSACVAEGLYSCFGFDSFNTQQDAVRADTPKLAARYRSEIEKIASNGGRDFFDSPLGLSQGFWRAVAESAVKTITSFSQSSRNLNGADFASCLLGVQNSLAVRIINVFASIGYQRLVIQGISSSAAASGDDQIQNPYDMDGYPSAPGTRQMKSRDGSLLSNASLAWRNSSLPSLFVLPVEAMAATLDMDYMFDSEKGSNPIKGMLGSTMYDKTYVRGNRNAGIIPSVVAKSLENRLSAEYVPFYFRDLRTNEIVAFHAFLETLTDGFTANFNETKGFGRADPVYNYSNTSRTLGTSFWIVSTSKEDFDEMWYKVNKLTTLVYPQYTRGRPVVAKNQTMSSAFPNLDGDVNFEQPFSQLVGGTPIVRMRIGDLVKTNYSRYNFAKIFGVGNDTFGLTSAAVGGLVGGLGDISNSIQSKSIIKQKFDIRLAPFLLVAASPMELTQLGGFLGSSIGAAAAQAALDFTAEIFTYVLKNGFVNPLLDNEREKFFRNYSTKKTGPAEDSVFLSASRNKVILKARSTPYSVTLPDGSIKNLRLQRPVFARIRSGVAEDSGAVYDVELEDVTVGERFNSGLCKVSAADLYIDAGQIVDIASYPGFLLSVGLITGATGLAANVGSNLASAALTSLNTAPVDLPLADFLGTIQRTFTSPYNNSITHAFEDRMGDGLAGVIKQMSFTWMDVGGWEVDWNCRAPMACKVNISFHPIHDIAPGLDSNGFNRAPIYNVGQIMHDSFGNPKPDGGAVSRYLFKESGATAENARIVGQKPGGT
jgi:hypothetical protein